MIAFEQSITTIDTNLANLYSDYNPSKADYTTWNKVTYKGMYYELVSSSVPINYYPDLFPLYWKKLGVANKESVIDLRALTKSSKLGGFYVTFPLTWDMNYLAIGYYSTYGLKIEALDDTDTVVKTYIDEQQSINENVFDLWDYIYAPYSLEVDRTKFFKLTYVGTKIRVTFVTNETILNTADCGFIIAGSGINMGQTLSDVNFKFNSYSIINTDEFGVMSVDERVKQNIVDFESSIDRNEFMKKRNEIKKLYDRFLVFILDEENKDQNNEMVGVGKIQDFSQLYSEFDKSIIGWSILESV